MTTRDLVHGQVSDVSAPLALSALNNRWALAAPADFGSDVDVLNFALTLEYLEAAFYVQGNKAGLLSGSEKSYLKQIEKDEKTHVAAITDTINKLGGKPVDAPGVDFGGSFDSRESYLKTSHTFENTGVGAYLGAAGFIKDKTVLSAAASIFGVEARHAALVGNLLGLPAEGGVYMGAFEKGIAKADVLKGVAPFITQMNGMPSGGAGTGGGSAAAKSDNSGLIIGGAALLGAAGVAALAARRHSAQDESA